MSNKRGNSTSINEMAFKLFVEATQALPFGIRVLDVCEFDVGSAKVLDFAVGRKGTLEAGILLSRICMGGIGEVEILDSDGELPLSRVKVQTNSPLLSCIGAQYAGWPISSDDYFAMGSGPMRLLRGKEAILEQYDLFRGGTNAVGVLESNELPAKDVIELIAGECSVLPRDVCLCVARTASLPGSIQVVARSVEVAMHKLYELQFDLAAIVDATGIAPLPPIPDDDMTALGWTNDAILYGATVKLNVETTDEAIEAVVKQIPSCSSDEFGKPFLDIFDKFDRDFYKIDKMLFSPAEVVITNQSTGRVFHVGEIRNDVLKQSFGIG